MGKPNPTNFNADDLRTTQWVGIVEDSNDDIFEGRCKIRVYGKMDDRVDPEDPEVHTRFLLQLYRGLGLIN